MTPAARWDLRAGQFFFRRRNALFPCIFVLVVPFLRPSVMFGDPPLDARLAACGAAVAIAGALVRLSTIGFQYIERGGKHRQIHASYLAQRGMYALTRNPMYVGNGLIAIGMVMVTGAFLSYVLLLPFFLFVYWSIVRAEEAYLLGRFGQTYAQYCASVPRFMPSRRGWGAAFAGIRYDWRRAIRKDLSTLAGLLTGLILLPLWRIFFLQGRAAAMAAAPRALAMEAAMLGLFWWAVWLKKRRRFFYAPDEREALQ